MNIKIQFKYLLPTEAGEKAVSRTFSRVNEEATKEELLQFKDALGNIVKEEHFLYKVSTENVQ